MNKNMSARDAEDSTVLMLICFRIHLNKILGNSILCMNAADVAHEP